MIWRPNAIVDFHPIYCNCSKFSSFSKITLVQEEKKLHLSQDLFAIHLHTSFFYEMNISMLHVAFPKQNDDTYFSNTLYAAHLHTFILFLFYPNEENYKQRFAHPKKNKILSSCIMPHNLLKNVYFCTCDEYSTSLDVNTDLGLSCIGCKCSVVQIKHLMYVYSS